VPLSIEKAREEDEAWLFELYRTTMKEYVEKTWGWDEAVQHDGFTNHLGVANFVICLHDNDTAGCFCLKDEGDHLWLHLVLIDPQLQNRGIGRAIMEHIESISSAADKPMRLCTMKVSPATEFYRHLGYIQYKEDEACVYFSKNP
jgi:N-acetylglutamate synthase-like GNAT family acetyltransferase